MSARVLATIALISACSGCGTANLSRVCWRSSRKASHSVAVIFRCWCDSFIERPVYFWVCIQAGINHDPVDEIINHGGDAIDTAEPIVQGGCVLHSHLCSSSFRFPRLVLAPIDWIFK